MNVNHRFAIAFTRTRAHLQYTGAAIVCGFDSTIEGNPEESS